MIDDHCVNSGDRKQSQSGALRAIDYGYGSGRNCIHSPRKLPQRWILERGMLHA